MIKIDATFLYSEKNVRKYTPDSWSFYNFSIPSIPTTGTESVEITNITLPAGSSITGADYFTIHDPTISYYVWYTVDAAGADPTPGGTGIQVDILSTDTALQVAVKTAAEIDAEADFSCPVPTTSTITVTNVDPGAVTDAASGVGVTGIEFSVTQQGGQAANEVEITFTSSDIPTHGEIHTIRVACASTDFDLSLREKPDLTLPDVNVFYISTGNNGYLLDRNSSILWSNNEDPEVNKFYGVFKNNDGVNATGTITIQFILKPFTGA